MFYCFYMFDSSLMTVIRHCWAEQFTKWMPVLVIYLDFALHSWYDLSLIYPFNPSVIFESGLPKVKLRAKFRPRLLKITFVYSRMRNSKHISGLKQRHITKIFPGHFSHKDRFWVSLYLLPSNVIRHTHHVFCMFACT